MRTVSAASILTVMGLSLLIAACGRDPVTPRVDCEGNPPELASFDVALSSNVAILSWNLPPSSTAAGVRILRKEDGAPTSPSDASATIVATVGLQTTTYADSSVSTGNVYYYRAWVFDACEDFSRSPSDAVLSPVAAPVASCTAGIHSLKLNWSPITGASQYVIRAATSGYPDFQSGREVYRGSGLTWTETGLSPTTTQYYSAFAISVSGTPSGPGKCKGTPLWETRTFTWEFVAPTVWWPGSSSGGDCDFAGHGPKITFSGTLSYSSTKRIRAVTTFRAEEWNITEDEPQNNFTTRYGSKDWGLQDFLNTTELSGGGWLLDQITGPMSFNSQTIDTNGHSDNGMPSNGALVSATVVGDTSEGDACGTTSDDTRVKTFKLRTTVRFKR
jgi:hypothetical protein